MDHPATTGWQPVPPPARRRAGAGLVAVLIAALLLVGATTLVAARGSSAQHGAATPEAAVEGLLAALEQPDLGEAARFLPGEEGLALRTYGERALALATREAGGTRPGIIARDVTFRRVRSGPGAAVLELAGGTVGVRGPGGGVGVPVQELNRRLAASSGGERRAVRVVTVRAGDRWYVSLLGTALELGTWTAGAWPVDEGLLGRELRGGGAATPEAAVLALVEDGRLLPPGRMVAALTPYERRVLGAYLGSLDGWDDLGRLARGGEPAPGVPWARPGASDAVEDLRVTDLSTRTEQVGEGLVRVYLTGATVELDGERRRLPRAGAGQRQPYLVAVRHGGAWYPSLLLTLTDHAVNEAERE